MAKNVDNFFCTMKWLFLQTEYSLNDLQVVDFEPVRRIVNASSAR